ncbi:MAG: hypothetical protein ABUK01_07035 [Leptospirales bacterium]
MRKKLQFFWDGGKIVKTNILKIDNWFIRIGMTVLIISTLWALTETMELTHFKIYSGKTKGGSAVFEHHYSDEAIESVQELYPGQYVEDAGIEQTTPLTVGLLIFFIVSGLGLWLGGLRFRSWEKKIFQLWKILRHTREISLADLQSGSNLDLKAIQKALPIINAQAAAFYVLDLQEKKIIDGRLRTEYALNEKCPNCGNAINQMVTLANLSELACAYCNTALPADFFNNTKSKILNELYKKTDLPGQFTEKKKLNIVVLILLVMFFWPAAIVYVYRRTRIPDTAS